MGKYRRTSPLHYLGGFNRPQLFAGVMSLIVLVALIIHLIDQHRYVRSDDALIQSHFTTLTAKMAGTVNTVYVKEHDSVKEGQLLARLDVQDYQARLQEVQKIQAATQIELETAKKDFLRALHLYREKEISDQRYDQIRTAYFAKKFELEQNLAETSQAQLNLGYTEIVAPADGIIALRAATVGMEVKEGDPLFGMVFPKEKWVEARVKETDLKDLKIGASVSVWIDAIPGREFIGIIKSLSPSTEGMDAALVPDNSSGNFTKYVQRVPMRVALDLLPEDQEQVRTGLSVEIRIRRPD